MAQKFRRDMVEAGIFTWNLDSNVLFADSAIADFFGLEPSSTIAGLPIETYIDSIHPDDRAETARSIHDAVLTGQAAEQSYRVRGEDGRYRSVVALGRCFRDEDGEPALYAGIVFTAVGKESSDAALKDACAKAYWLALESRREDVARKLIGIILDMNGAPLSPGASNWH